MKSKIYSLFLPYRSDRIWAIIFHFHQKISHQMQDCNSWLRAELIEVIHQGAATVIYRGTRQKDQMPVALLCQ
ncbi:hypothetical protein [Aerosakkonema funiforme]|uniref:hypothetical protein n=1 Tax=Aerosakkonema funiforme TaxID=1246630 RepID=UPI0035B8545D